MTPYQLLLDEAVALVNAERGFIVLYDPATGIPIQIVAAHNFASALVFQPVESVSKDYQVIQKALPLMAREKQPLLTHNYEERYFSPGNYEGVIPNRPFRNVIVVPLHHANGLLWCDTPMVVNKPEPNANPIFRVYHPSDLEQLTALVEWSAVL